VPTYEYACKSCGEHLEVVQAFADEPLTRCPSCGGPLRKVFGSIGVVLKGSGFYRTDNRGGGRSEPKVAEARSGDAKADAKAGDAKAGDAKSGDARSGGAGGTRGGEGSGTASGGPKEPKAAGGSGSAPSGGAASTAKSA